MHSLRSMLVTDIGDQMCWWQVWDIANLLVTDIIILSPTSQISYHHKVTNITMSPTSLSPCTHGNNDIGDKIVMLMKLSSTFTPTKMTENEYSIWLNHCQVQLKTKIRWSGFRFVHPDLEGFDSNFIRSWNWQGRI